MTVQKTRVLIMLDDLMFMVKIQEALKRANLPGIFVKSQEDLLAKAREDARLIILDLNYAKAEPLSAIARLKSDTVTGSIPLLGYVSHVQTELRQAAIECGCDTVVARSAFVQNLPAFLLQLS